MSPGPQPTAARTRMFREAAQAPGVVRAQLGENRQVLQRLAQRLRESPPRVVVTLGRGSSDHAATFARYLIETRLGIMSASAAPSVSSIYDASPGMKDTVCLVISQSGQSPDLLTAAQAAAEPGRWWWPWSMTRPRRWRDWPTSWRL